MGRTPTISEIEALLRPVVEDLGYELVDVRLQTDRGRRVLRLLADRPGGITIGECVGLSREVSPHLEVHDPIAGHYVLEVSSPGIQRPLKRAEDFVRFRDEQIALRTREAVDGRKVFRGTNRGLDPDGKILLFDSDTQAVHAIPPSLVREAHLDPDVKF